MAATIQASWGTVMEYRWERASGGEIPSGACAQGHGWMWDSDYEEKEPLWVARWPDADAGEVRLGYVARSDGDRLGGQEQPVDEYEVLLDEGRWVGGEWVEEGDDIYVEVAGVGGVAWGYTTDGSPLYVTLMHGQEGDWPEEAGARIRSEYRVSVLVAPVEAPAAEEPDGGPAAQQSAGADAAAPAAVISVLDCKNELVEITNAGGGALDLSSWKLHDESSRKGYVFPAGTILTSGASVRVRSGPGAKTPAAGELAWKTATVWNDEATRPTSKIPRARSWRPRRADRSGRESPSKPRLVRQITKRRESQGWRRRSARVNRAWGYDDGHSCDVRSMAEHDRLAARAGRIGNIKRQVGSARRRRWPKRLSLRRLDDRRADRRHRVCPGDVHA